MTAGAQAVANAAHMSWEDLSSAILYEPLGMSSTSSRYADFMRRSNKAALHVLVGTRWVSRSVRDADAQSPAGGVSSSIRDMAQWLRFELANGKYNGKQVVEEGALLATRRPAIAIGEPDSPISRVQFYGFGTNVNYDAAGRVRLSHSGAFANGAATAFMLLPSERLGIVVLTNGLPVGVPEAITYDFMDRVEFGKPKRDWYAVFKPDSIRSWQTRASLPGRNVP